MKIALKDYYYKDRVGDGPITLVKSPYYSVNGVSVGTRTVGDMIGARYLDVLENVRAFFAISNEEGDPGLILMQEFLRWEFTHVCDKLSKRKGSF